MVRLHPVTPPPRPKRQFILKNASPRPWKPLRQEPRRWPQSAIAPSTRGATRGYYGDFSPGQTTSTAPVPPLPSMPPCDTTKYKKDAQGKAAEGGVEAQNESGGTAKGAEDVDGMHATPGVGYRAVHRISGPLIFRLDNRYQLNTMFPILSELPIRYAEYEW